MLREDHETIRVLLVDDDPAVRLGYERTLAVRGMSVKTASNGKEAVEHVKSGAFDVILSDITI